MNRYFYDLQQEERALHEHGFSSFPTEKELLEKIFELEDRIKKLEKGSCEAGFAGDRCG